MMTIGPASLEHFEDRVLYHIVQLTGGVSALPQSIGDGVDQTALATQMAADLGIDPVLPRTDVYQHSNALGALYESVRTLEREGLVDGALMMGGHFEVSPTLVGRRRVGEWQKDWDRARQALDR